MIMTTIVFITIFMAFMIVYIGATIVGSLFDNDTAYSVADMARICAILTLVFITACLLAVGLRG